MAKLDSSRDSISNSWKLNGLKPREIIWTEKFRKSLKKATADTIRRVQETLESFETYGWQWGSGAHRMKSTENLGTLRVSRWERILYKQEGNGIIELLQYGFHTEIDRIIANY